MTTVVSGGTPRTDDPTNWVDGDVAWVTPADLSGYTEMRIARGARNISKRGLESSAARLLPPGTVLMSSRAPVGYVAIASEALSTNQGFKSFLPSGALLPEYLYYFLLGNKDLVLEFASGTTFLEVSGKKAAQIPVPVPPVAEQGRIVDAVEEHLSRLDAAVAGLERVHAQLTHYRAAAIDAACEGRLVPLEAELAREEGRQYESAPQLLQRVTLERQRLVGGGSQRRSMKPEQQDMTGLAVPPEGWTWARWGQIGFSQNGRAFPSSDYSQQGVRLLRPGNLHVSGKVRWTDDNTRRLPERWAVEYPGFLVGENELVMNLTAQSLKDEFLGRICITGPGEPCLLNQRIARLTPILVEPRYLLWMFKARRFRHYVESLNTGSLIQHMFTSQLAEFVCPLPPREEQIRIAAEVERRLSLAEAIEGTIGLALARAAALRQAILKRAFQGKLVPQDPNDEPADKLLERIREQRSEVSGNQRRRPRTKSGVST